MSFEEVEEPLKYRVKSKHVNIKDPDLSKIDLPEDLKKVAIKIYRTYGVATHVGRNRNKILYGCFYIAGLQLGKPQIPHQLMNAIGFEKRKKNTCDGIIQEIQAKIGSQCHIFTPPEITEPFLVNHENGSENLKKINALWEDLKDDPRMKRKDVKSIAIWLLTHLKFDEAELCEFYGVSEAVYRKNVSFLD